MCTGYDGLFRTGTSIRELHIFVTQKERYNRPQQTGRSYQIKSYASSLFHRAVKSVIA